MKSGRLYRLGVFGLFTAGALVTAVACSDDDKPAAQPQNDSGPIDTTDSGAADTGAPDANKPDATAPKQTLVVNIAHGMSDLDNVQFCFEVGGTFPLADPLPATGIGPGQGGPLPIADNFLPLLSTVSLTPYVFPKTANAGAKCADIVAGDAGVAPADVHKLNTIASGTLTLGHSFLVVFTGCKAGNESGTCGPDYNGETGNLRNEILTLDGVAKGDDKFGFQFVHASPEAQAVTEGVFGTATVQAQLVEGDTKTNIGSAIGFTKTPTVTPATGIESTTALSDSAKNGVGIVAPDGGAFPMPIFVPFDTISLMTTGAADAGYFAKGSDYTFVALGNPGLPDQTKPHGFRIIALKSSLPAAK